MPTPSHVDATSPGSNGGAGRPRPTVFVGPQAAPDILAAVRRGGGVPVHAPGQARAIVWLGMDPAACRDHLTPNVEWVHLRQAGVDRWIAAGVIDDRRTWTCSAGVFGRLVGERAVALLLAGVHRLGEHAAARRWSRLPGAVLAGRTVVVLGTGSIGGAVANALGALGASCLGVSRSGSPVAGFAEVHGVDTWPGVCDRGDHLVVTVPLTERTRGMVDGAAIAALAPGAVLVNVGRGPVVDTGAVVAALEAGRLGAAMLDVTDPEPLPVGHRLWHHEQAVITSHTANPSHEHAQLLAARVEDNVRRWSAGRPLAGIVDVARGY